MMLTKYFEIVLTQNEVEGNRYRSRLLDLNSNKYRFK